MRWRRSETETWRRLLYVGDNGEPKGVMLTHGNLASNINYSRQDGVGEKDSCISFLPLCM